MFSHIDKIVEQKTGFSISEHGIVLKGTCAECSAIKN
jgi:Fe2+ or Zn2+ uptake regulation protein